MEKKDSMVRPDTDADKAGSADRQNTEQEKRLCGGYLFRTAEDAGAAGKELAAVQETEQRMQTESVEQIHAEYLKLLEEHTFRTPVGLGFLHEVREYLVKNGISEQLIPSVSVPFYVTDTRWRYSRAADQKQQKEKQKRTLRADRLQISILLNIFLVLLVAGMFFIALDSKNPNILNYKTAIVNQYASWEESIAARESTVREKEAALSSAAAGKNVK